VNRYVLSYIRWTLISFVENKTTMELTVFSDERFMKEALKEAQKASEADEVPVGAVVVHKNTIIARAHNYTEHLNDVTAHAEMQAFTAAADYLGSKYLDECTLYVTLEPCVMCAGAAFWTQIGKVVFGAADERRGYRAAAEKSILHPKTEVVNGIMAEECGALVKNFFKSKR
jgi:tRNA(adenine34) deaminase